MKRWLQALAMAARLGRRSRRVCLWAVAVAILVGTGSGGAQTPATPPTPAYLQNVGITGQPGTPAAGTTLQPGPNSILAERPEEEPNRDILVTPEVGPWMVCVASYTGTEAHSMARQLVAELRGSNYKLPAYVFNHGAEERKKERERVLTLLKQQKEALQQQQQGQNEEPNPEAQSLLQRANPRWTREQGLDTSGIRVRYTRVQEQVAVLVGGFRDMDSARRALDQMRKLKPPDPKKVKLDSMWIMRQEKPGEVKGEQVFSNPFAQGFVVRNPSAIREQPAEQPKMDLAMLRRLNSDEEFSLLKCPKQYSLLVKVLSVPTRVQSRDSPTNNLWNKAVPVSSSDEDAAAHSAHSLAAFFRQAGFDSYVLHTKFFSAVTVGSFERLDDPRLQRTREWVGTISANPTYALFALDPAPRPIQVPR